MFPLKTASSKEGSSSSLELSSLSIKAVSATAPNPTKMDIGVALAKILPNACIETEIILVSIIKNKIKLYY